MNKQAASAPPDFAEYQDSDHFKQLGGQMQDLFQGGFQQSSATKHAAANFSDQKTPNGHPNTFLYRAHINLNELSSANREEYNQMQLADMHNNVSAFYNDEFEEQKGASEEAPLRIPNHQSGKKNQRGSEMEMQQPIM